MNTLSLEYINSKSPYHVAYGGKDNFGFITDNKVVYDVSFMEDMDIAGCQTYQFSIRRLNDSAYGHDAKVKDTILPIIEEFFNANHDVLIYICDDSDGREEMRNRLFIRWFTEYDYNSRFIIKTANANIEDKGFYTAIIVEKSHPQIKAIETEFDEVAAQLTSK